MASISSSVGQISFRRISAAVCNAEYVVFNIETDAACQRVGNDQRRRSKESLFRIRMDTAVKVAITGQYGGSVQIAVDDFFLDFWIQRAAHAVTGGTCEGNDTEA